MTKQRSIILSLALAFSFSGLATPVYALDVPKWTEKTPPSERTFSASPGRAFWNWATRSQRVIPVVMSSRLTRPLLVVPETTTAPTVLERWRQELLQIPIRPVRIGRTPRLPDDPTTGIGFVFRLPFSL